MNVDFIERHFDEIYAKLTKEVLTVLNDESLDKKETNLAMKPLTSTKQILQNALDSIKMVNKLSEENE